MRTGSNNKLNALLLLAKELAGPFIVRNEVGSGFCLAEGFAGMVYSFSDISIMIGSGKDTALPPRNLISS